MLAGLGLVGVAPAALAQETDTDAATVSRLSAEQIFVLASQLESSDHTADAEQIYRALEDDPRLEIRNEARFRHAYLLGQRREFDGAIALYRAILAEQPEAQRVRVELAALLAQTGDVAGARRELDEAQAGGLPPEVARMVDQYSAALRSREPFGVSFEFALAPSNNINRATMATTLDTVLAPFQLSDDARAQSGVGARLGAQAFYRVPLDPKSKLVFRVAGQGSFYKASSFNDMAATIQVGVESDFGTMKVRPAIGRSYRWYGGDYYAATDNASVEVQAPVAANAQVTADVGFGRADYQLNDLQDGNIYTAGLLYERAFSGDMGGGVGLSLQRQEARDPGYATMSGGLRGLLWWKFEDISMFGDVRVSRLEADERLTLFPDRRADWQYGASLGATLPRFAIGGFAPVLRLSYERNQSTVGIYDYARVAGDIAFTRAF